jgi:Mg2+-importing ATPase
MNFSQYTTKKIEEIFDIFKTGEKGLSDNEADERLKKYGFNEVKTKRTTLFDVFIRQFKSPFVYMLIVATIIAFVIGEELDALVIAAFILINVFLGFFQEARAERAILILKKYFPSRTRILRNGEEKIIDKKFLVPGDVVLLEQGNIAPADMMISRSENLLVDESVLTGESVPVFKTNQPLKEQAKEIFEAKNIIFAGTAVISGEMEGIVIATGKETVMGEVTKLVSTISRESIYEKNLLKFSRLILKLVVITIVVLFLANLIIKGTTNILQFSVFCIALIVGIIPEALPLVAVVSLSNGALKLAKEKVVARRLSAVEDLGNIEVLCSDKTGTLTEGKMILEKVFSINKEKCLSYALLSSSYMEEEIESSLNPFDSAVYQQVDGDAKVSLNKFKIISEIPFNSERLRNSVLIKSQEGKTVLIVKGAPETILKLSSKFEDSQTLEQIKKQIEGEGKKGKRILAVAYKEFDKKDYLEDDEKNLTFLGYFSFRDPLKPTAKKSIQLAEKLGVEVKIVTGDSKEVSGYVAKEIGLIKNPQEVVLGEEMENLSDEEFMKVCEKFSVFARISPRIKYRIVEALGKKYEIGFLGEGINDAPALKISNLAIAVEGAADVSREVSDIILLEKDLHVIINGINQGRNVFSNINKYIKTTLASNFGNFISIAIISLMIPFLPMLPIQILLVNLLSDFPLIAVATDRVDAEELSKPKYYQLNRVIMLIVFLGLISTIFDFIFFAIFHKVEPSLLQTLWYIESILTEIILIFSVRTAHFFAKTKRPSFPLAITAVASILITIVLPFTFWGDKVFHFIRPDIHSLLIVFALIGSYFILSEIAKLFYFRFWMNKKQIKHA